MVGLISQSPFSVYMPGCCLLGIQGELNTRDTRFAIIFPMYYILLVPPISCFWSELPSLLLTFLFVFFYKLLVLYKLHVYLVSTQ